MNKLITMKWSLDFSPIFPVSIILFIAVLLFILLVFNIREINLSNVKNKSRLIFMNILAFLSIFIILMDPQLQKIRSNYTPQNIFIMIDSSESLNLKYDQDKKRWNEIVSLLSSVNFRDNLGNNKIKYFTWGDKISEITSLEQLKKITLPDENNSILDNKLKNVIDKTRSSLGAVLIFTDGGIGGRWKNGLTEEDDEYFRNLNIPIYFFVTSTVNLKDVGITGIQVPPIGYTHEPIDINAVVRNFGYESKRITLTLWNNQEIIDEKNLTIKQNNKQKIKFKIVNHIPGSPIYKVTLSVNGQDDFSFNNNLLFKTKIISPRYRILHLSGKPSWDVTFMRRFLKSNPRFDIISFYVLRNTEDLPFSSPQDLSLIPFPRKELFEKHLEEFDIIIFHNFAVDAPDREGGKEIDNVIDFVKNGGGVVFIGGNDSFSSGGYSESKVQTIMPVKLINTIDRNDKSLLITDEFIPTITEKGKNHPITSYINEKISVYNLLPKIKGINLTAGLSVGAISLLDHPSINSQNIISMLAVRDFEKGRVVSLTIDSLWQWWLGEAKINGQVTIYPQLWNKIFKWILHDPEMNRIIINYPEKDLIKNQEIPIEVVIKNQSYEPDIGKEVSLEISAIDLLQNDIKNAEIIKKVGETDSSGIFRFLWNPQESGIYNIKVLVNENGENLITEEQNFVKQNREEYEIAVTPNRNLMERIAELTKGKCFYNIDKIPSDINYAQQIPLDSIISNIPLGKNFIVFIVFILSIFGRWILRKKAGMI